MYYHGQGAPKDYAEAARWYKLAAEQGNASAQVNLGFMYDEGQGVSKSLIQAYLWYNLSAAQGNENAIKNRKILEREMTAAQIEEAQRLSTKYRPKP